MTRDDRQRVAEIQDRVKRFKRSKSMIAAGALIHEDIPWLIETLSNYATRDNAPGRSRGDME